jgi:hypothetical protein
MTGRSASGSSEVAGCSCWSTKLDDLAAPGHQDDGARGPVLVHHSLDDRFDLIKFGGGQAHFLGSGPRNFLRTSAGEKQANRNEGNEKRFHEVVL